MVESSDGVGGSDRDGRFHESKYRHLVAHVQDAVVEFEQDDTEPIVRDVNQAFVDVFGYDRDEVRGESLNALIVPEWGKEEATELDERTAAGTINYRRVKRTTTNGLREFLYRGIPVEDEAVPIDGIAVYTDLTDITRRERRVQVMNRILRHNLRNEVNVILGHTTRLLDELDEQSDERTNAAARIERAAHDLRNLAREANDIERVLTADVHDATIDCVPLVEQICTDYARRVPEASIETDLPESMDVRASGHLRIAIESLVDNAIEHNPADRPTVRVEVATADSTGWVDVCVDDDGPEIPADERRVITGAAEISSLRHGSGLGLWMAKWTTELFGGEIAFGTSELGGNRVRLRIPSN